MVQGDGAAAAYGRGNDTAAGCAYVIATAICAAEVNAAVQARSQIAAVVIAFGERAGNAHGRVVERPVPGVAVGGPDVGNREWDGIAPVAWGVCHFGPRAPEQGSIDGRGLPVSDVVVARALGHVVVGCHDVVESVVRGDLYFVGVAAVRVGGGVPIVLYILDIEVDLVDADLFISPGMQQLGQTARTDGKDVGAGRVAAAIGDLQVEAVADVVGAVEVEVVAVRPRAGIVVLRWLIIPRRLVGAAIPLIRIIGHVAIKTGQIGNHQHVRFDSHITAAGRRDADGNRLLGKRRGTRKPD